MLAAFISIIIVSIIIGIIFAIAGIEPPPKRAPHRGSERQMIANKDPFDHIEKDLIRLRKENEEWSKEHTLSTNGRKKGKALEREGRLLEAIEVYEECVKQGIESKRIHIYNYAHDIERLFVLYRKTKQKDKEIVFLQDMIKKHPKYNNLHQWQERLDKLTLKYKL